MAETINFDADTVSTVPSGWTTGVTGRGAYRWTVENDASAVPAQCSQTEWERGLSLVRQDRYFIR